MAVLAFPSFLFFFFFAGPKWSSPSPPFEPIRVPFAVRCFGIAVVGLPLAAIAQTHLGLFTVCRHSPPFAVVRTRSSSPRRPLLCGHRPSPFAVWSSSGYPTVTSLSLFGPRCSVLFFFFRVTRRHSRPFVLLACDFGSRPSPFASPAIILCLLLLRTCSSLPLVPRLRSEVACCRSPPCCSVGHLQLR